MRRAAASSSRFSAASISISLPGTVPTKITSPSASVPRLRLLLQPICEAPAESNISWRQLAGALDKIICDGPRNVERRQLPVETERYADFAIAPKTGLREIVAANCNFHSPHLNTAQ